MNILLVDDEPLALMRLRRLIESNELGNVIAEAKNGVQALEEAQKLAPDVILMDIQMPLMDGLEAAKHLAQWPTPPAVIFCTAYEEYALQAFDVQAVGYLLKPVRLENLKSVLSNLAKINKVQASALIEGSRRSHISAKTHQGLELVPIENIILFRSDHKYISVFHDNGETLIDESLKDLEEEFEKEFVRVHRNALVNVNSITGLDKLADGSMALKLNGFADSVPVSRRHVAAVRKLLKAL